VAESKNIHSPLLPKIATGFCSGMAQTSNLCGAVSGAIMAISLFSGRSAPDDELDTNYTMVQKLINMFENEFGTTNCRQLLGCDLKTAQGQNKFMEEKLIKACKLYTQKATEMAMSIIEERY